MEREAGRKALYRDPKHALVGGVCAGIAERLDIDMLLARVAAVVALIMTCGLAGLVYLALWTVLPVKPVRTTFVEVQPRRVRSERYGHVVTTELDAQRREHNADRASEEEASWQPRRRVIGEEGLRAYRRPLVCFLASCLIVTIAIVLILAVIPNLDFMSFLPLYFIPLGILLVAEPGAARSAIVRACIMILCIEACSLFLPFTLGVTGYESLGLFGPSTFITWLIALVIMFAAIVFENPACYLFAVLLIFMAITISFYDFGFFDSAAMFSSSRV